jgi:hypothetical protein
MEMRVTRIQVTNIMVRRTRGAPGLENGFHDVW